MRPRLTPAAAGLMRALMVRAREDKDKILLTDWSSTDWHSLTFAGERHEVTFRISGPDSPGLCSRLFDSIGEADIPISGQFVADIALVGEPLADADGALVVRLEALTITQ